MVATQSLNSKMTPSYWLDAINYLSTQDAILANLIKNYPNCLLKNHHNPFHTLTRAIVGQQISIKVADVIWSRLEGKLKSISPEHFLALEEEALRECGLSRQKINYITNVAIAFEQNILTPEQWQEMSDTEVMKQLTSIKGIGQWTAEMFLIFHLHRPDIFPLADLGLINAIKLHYGEMSKSEIKAFSQQWQPYRTVATWYLWRSLDPVTVQY
jgi:DNA-3-methyladenine glycosylase II